MIVVNESGLASTGQACTTDFARTMPGWQPATTEFGLVGMDRGVILRRVDFSLPLDKSRMLVQQRRPLAMPRSTHRHADWDNRLAFLGGIWHTARPHFLHTITPRPRSVFSIHLLGLQFYLGNALERRGSIETASCVAELRTDGTICPGRSVCSATVARLT